MRIHWYGHASFGIKTDNGIMIVADPYDPEKAGFRPFPHPADIVIKSGSNDDFHDNDHLVPKKDGAAVIGALPVALGGGETRSHGIHFRAIVAMEHLDHPYRDLDQNAMYRLNINGIKIGHMGDTGNNFSGAQMAFFDDVDVLLSHAGGYPVISMEELKRIVTTVNPRLVIPMHFRTLCYKPKDMHFVSEFVNAMGENIVDFAGTATVPLSKSELPKETRALVLAYH